MAALADPESVERVYVEAGIDAPRAGEMLNVAASAGVRVERLARGECDRLAETRSQGVAARVRFSYSDLEPILETPQGLLVFLDGIEDPHNLGAIVRTAEAAGALAVVVPARRSAMVTSAVVRASAGAALQLPICRPTNLVRALEQARKAGFWVIGLDHTAESVLESAAADARTALVVGGEGRGLGRLVRESCDSLANLPMVGRVESLNASVAAALAIYRTCHHRLYGPQTC